MSFMLHKAKEAFNFFDPDLEIDWEISMEKVILSAKDMQRECLKDIVLDFDYQMDLYSVQ